MRLTKDTSYPGWESQLGMLEILAAKGWVGVDKLKERYLSLSWNSCFDLMITEVNQRKNDRHGREREALPLKLLRSWPHNAARHLGTTGRRLARLSRLDNLPR